MGILFFQLHVRDVAANVIYCMNWKNKEATMMNGFLQDPEFCKLKFKYLDP
jgi:hypothetical protein